MLRVGNVVQPCPVLILTAEFIFNLPPPLPFPQERSFFFLFLLFSLCVMTPSTCSIVRGDNRSTLPPIAGLPAPSLLLPSLQGRPLSSLSVALQDGVARRRERRQQNRVVVTGPRGSRGVFLPFPPSYGILLFPAAWPIWAREISLI